MFSKVGFIGTGNMGGALAIAADKSDTGAQILLCDKDSAKAAALAEKLHYAKAVDFEEVVLDSDIIFLGVKPQMLHVVVADICEILSDSEGSWPVIVSMAAGVDMASIPELGTAPLIRIMPNIPVAVGAGTILFCAKNVSEDDLMDFEELMAPAGFLDNISESMIDAASAVSGCGPAYAYLFIEALADGAVKCGLTRDKAIAYAASTLKGAAEMVLETHKHPAELKDAVCSPGGTTIEGVRELEKGGFRAAAMEAVIAAYEKTLEMKPRRDE